MGGTDIHTQNVCNSLAKNGHQIVIISTQPFNGLKSFIPSRTTLKNMTIYQFYPLNIYSWIYSSKKNIILRGIWHIIDIWNLHSYIIIRKILNYEKPDIIHIHTPIGLSFSVFSAVKWQKTPVIFTIHDYFLLCPKIILLNAEKKCCTKPHFICKLYRILTKILVNDVPDIVIGPSNFVINVFKINKFFEKKTMIVLPLGTLNFNEHPQKKSSHLIIFSYIGGLNSEKGVYILLKAFCDIKNENIRLNIVGKGSDDENIKHFINQDNRIQFHGFKQNHELDMIFEATDIVILPSLCLETFGMTILESFCYGIPVIGSNIGAYPELIIEGYNGFLFEPGNVTQLQNFIKQVSTDPNLIIKLQKGALATAQKRTHEEYITQLEKIYEFGVTQTQDKTIRSNYL
jgi:glycosyltransferase involved in cell wall biosynthesis